ncbi:MAG: Uma2 family endonuclease [Pyrinomonadaceae bacterium]|jgi:Uma2 family endonuclease|nr:Uma2 family endonuclease [Pyrinomonadaceae bacterium]
MTALLKHKYTLEEYFQIEKESNERFEFFDGEIYSMAGVNQEHDQIEWNLSGSFRNKLRGKQCRAFLANMRLKVPSLPPYRYSDGSALCGEAVFEKIGGVDVLVNPQLIIEVLSDSTEKFDRDQKFKHYKSIESFREYLLISQETYFVVHYLKHNEKFWMQTEYDKLEDIINLTTLDCDLTLAEIYEDIILPKIET